MTFYFGPTPILAPNQITGLVAWYKADTGVYSDAGVTPATNGGTVQQWNDQSGNGYHLKQATAGQRPTYRTTSFNGKTTLEFVTASSNFMATDANAVALPASCPAVSIFVIGQMHTETAQWGRIISFLANGSTNDWDNLYSLQIERNSTTDGIQSTTNSNSLSPTSITLAKSYRFGVITSAAGTTIFLDGLGNYTASARSTDFGGASNNGTFKAGLSGQATGEWWDGYISEIAFYNTEITGEEIGLLDAYFIDKWSF